MDEYSKSTAQYSHAIIEGQSRQTAGEQAGRVDEMCNRVENLSLVGFTISQNVLDVVLMTATSTDDQKNAKSSEDDIKELSRLNSQLSGWIL